MCLLNFILKKIIPAFLFPSLILQMNRMMKNRQYKSLFQSFHKLVLLSRFVFYLWHYICKHYALCTMFLAWDINRFLVIIATESLLSSDNSFADCHLLQIIFRQVNIARWKSFDFSFVLCHPILAHPYRVISINVLHGSSFDFLLDY